MRKSRSLIESTFSANFNARFILLAALSLLVAASNIRPSAQSESLIALVGGTLIDGNGGAPVQDAVVLIRGNKIVQAGGRIKYPTTAKVVDLKGKFILPGLIDMHVHYDGWMGELFLAHGVTTVKDTGNDVEWIAAMSADIERGRVKGPRLFYVGNGLDASPPAREHHVGLDGPDMAKRAVALLHSRGASAVKVREKLTPELLRAVVVQARKLGIPVTGHVSRANAREAALAGIDGLEHASGIVEATASLPARNKPARNELGHFIAELKAFSLIDPVKAEGLVKFLAKRKVALIPTMSNHWRMGSDRRDGFAREDAGYARDSSLAYVPEPVRQMWATSFIFNVRNADDLAQIKTGYKNLQDLLRRHHRAGGKILAGSDTLISVPGLSLQRELLFLTDAGLAPMQAITIATRDNARFLGKDAELGTVAAGKMADIVVLDANPLADINNIRKVAMVIKGGQIVDTSYHADYAVPTPKPKPTRPLWLERQLQQKQGSHPAMR